MTGRRRRSKKGKIETGEEKKRARERSGTVNKGGRHRERVREGEGTVGGQRTKEGDREKE